MKVGIAQFSAYHKKNAFQTFNIFAHGQKNYANRESSFLDNI